jgi:hypothetical protein
MSKMDGLRAMREARYAERATKAGAAAPRRAAPIAPAKAAAERPAPEEASTDALCGHRNMGGRTCTREQGHAAKSHRYS